MVLVLVHYSGPQTSKQASKQAIIAYSIRSHSEAVAVSNPERGEKAARKNNRRKVGQAKCQVFRGMMTKADILDGDDSLMVKAGPAAVREVL